MKKRISIALLLCLLLAACGEEAPVASGDTTPAPETTVDLYPDDLPDDLDLGGETVTFLYRQEILDEFYVDSQNGDIVNDALYDSLRSVEERLNVNIEAIAREGHLTNVRDEYMNHITSTVMAGDDTYDWVDLMIGNACVKLREGIFRDLTQLQYLDFTKPWYLKELTETVSLNGRLYFASGDASIGYLKNSFCFYFNKRLAEDYKRSISVMEPVPTPIIRSQSSGLLITISPRVASSKPRCLIISTVGAKPASSSSCWQRCPATW